MCCIDYRAGWGGAASALADRFGKFGIGCLFRSALMTYQNPAPIPGWRISLLLMVGDDLFHVLTKVLVEVGGESRCLALQDFGMTVSRAEASRLRRRAGDPPLDNYLAALLDRL